MQIEEILKEKKRTYHLLQSRLEKAKKDLLTSQEKIINVFHLKKIRERLTFLFTMHASQICKECQGRCCDGCAVWPDDVLYYALIDFEFPEPDWEFICLRTLNWQSNGLFLSKQGCLLGENKPYHCLISLCSQFSNLSTKLRHEIEDLIDEFRREESKLLNKNY